MALFKILKGQSANLPDVKATEGYAYFTPDDGKFYIDVATADKAVIGNNKGEIVDGKEVNRICINQKLFTYDDYDILDCGDAKDEFPPAEGVLIFNCGTSAIS